MIVLYYDAIEILVELIRIYIHKEKLVCFVENKPSLRLALIPVQKDELLKDGGKFFFVPGLVAEKMRQSFPDR